MLQFGILIKTMKKKYKYEIAYANACLNKIGLQENIAYLEKHADSKIRDIKISAKLAIESIMSRMN